MYFLRDNLAAIVVLSVATMIIGSLFLRTGSASMEATQYYANRGVNLDLQRMMSQDFANIGAAVPMELDAIVAYDGGTPTAFFEFRGAVAPDSAAPVERIRYELVFADSVEARLGGPPRTLPVYRLTRMVDAGGGFAPAGQSADNITSFEIRLLHEGEPLTQDQELDDTTELAVVMTTLTNRGGEATVTESRWATRYRIQNLK